jgi:glycosyltransferase involved in cell wall biosynthesis
MPPEATAAPLPTVPAPPLVTVAIPAYKGAAFIRATIESVLAQTLTDFELIVIDDGSPDATAAIAASFQDPRIRLLRNLRNLGPQGNWNRCLAEARGKYFKLLPQDDLLAADCLAQQVAVLEADTDERIALVFCARRILLPDGRPLMRRRYPARTGLLDGQAVINRCIRAGTNLIGEPGCGLYRRSLSTTIGDFDAVNPYVVDLDYWFRLLKTGHAYYLEAPLSAFRVSRGSWSVAIGNAQSTDFNQFIRRISATPGFAPSAIDRNLGRLRAPMYSCLRAVFYRLWLAPVRRVS